MERNPAQTHHGPTIAQLINERRGDRSYERLSRDCNGNPGAKRLQQLATNRPMNSFPDPETIQGLALGLGVSAADVLHALARTLGLVVAPEDPTVLKLQGAGTLPLDAQEALLFVAREMLKLHRTGAGAESRPARIAVGGVEWGDESLPFAAYDAREH